MLESYQPEMSCKEYMRTSNFKDALPGIGDLHYICDNAIILAEDRLNHQLIAPELQCNQQLSFDEAVAIAAYTFDLGLNGNKEDGSDNLYYILNVVLRERNAAKMQKLKPYLYYLMNGISKLPLVSSDIVYRGIPESALSFVQSNYKLGTHIHWSSFNSTSRSLQKAIDFAGPRGIIFRIKVINGRDLYHYSAIQEEDEIILSPNSRFIVTAECTLLPDKGYYRLKLIEQRVNDRVIF